MPPFRYYDYSPGTKLIGCVGRFDIVQNFPEPPEPWPRIIADYTLDDMDCYVLLEAGEPLSELKFSPRSNARLSDVTPEEREAIRLLLQTFLPERI